MGTEGRGPVESDTGITIGFSLGAVLYNQYTSPRYNQIRRVDPWRDVSTLEGDLAESWSISVDGLTLTIKLHEGVLFHDGSPMTCADAEYSTKSYINPRSGLTTWGKTLLMHVTDVSCNDARTLVIKMNAVLGSTMATIASGTMRAVKKEALQALDAAGGGASRGQRSTSQTIEEGWTRDGALHPGQLCFRREGRHQEEPQLL